MIVSRNFEMNLTIFCEKVCSQLQLNVRDLNFKLHHFECNVSKEKVSENSHEKLWQNKQEGHNGPESLTRDGLATSVIVPN